MMDYKDINNTALYVLKIDNKGRFYTDYYPVDKSLLKKLDLEKIYAILDDSSYHEDKNLSNEEKEKIHKYKQGIVLDFIKELYSKYKYLFEYRDYCLSLNSSYSTFRSLCSIEDISLAPYDALSSYNTLLIINSVHYKAAGVKSYIEMFFNTYFIDEAIKECKKNNLIKVYSHRYSGWTNFKFPLNNDLSVNINTNFGFGYASYFTVTLIYKGIKIIPYSRLVFYRFIDVKELINHTQEYSLYNENWDLALDFIRDACNSLLEDGHQSFIGKYFITECDVLARYLSDYMQNNTFLLHEKINGRITVREQENIKKISIILSGYELIIFRAKKINNAIYFTEGIKKLNILFPTQKYLDKINECCRIAINQLDENINKINVDIPKLKKECEKIEKELDVTRSKFNDIKPTYQKRQDDYYGICEMILEINKGKEGYMSIHSYEVRKEAIDKVKEIYKDWDEIENKYTTLKYEFDEKDNSYRKIIHKVATHKEYKDEMEESKEKITEYLETVN